MSNTSNTSNTHRHHVLGSHYRHHHQHNSNSNGTQVMLTLAISMIMLVVLLIFKTISIVVWGIVRRIIKCNRNITLMMTIVIAMITRISTNNVNPGNSYNCTHHWWYIVLAVTLAAEYIYNTYIYIISYHIISYHIYGCTCSTKTPKAPILKAAKTPTVAVLGHTCTRRSPPKKA